MNIDAAEVLRLADKYAAAIVLELRETARLGGRLEGWENAEVEMRFTARARLETGAHASIVQSDEDTYDMKSELICQVEELLSERDGCRQALFQAQESAKLLLAKGEMLAAVVQGAKEEFVRVPYGASHEDVAAINDWHKMAADALAAWDNKS